LLARHVQEGVEQHLEVIRRFSERQGEGGAHSSSGSSSSDIEYEVSFLF
jgi:hypothetical protein